MRAGDGDSALRSIDANPPDMVLLDLNLPSLDGTTVVHDLASNPSTRNIPIIVVTGVDPPPLLPHVRTVLCKPCDPEYVAKVVTDHLPAPR